MTENSATDQPARPATAATEIPTPQIPSSAAPFPTDSEMAQRYGVKPRMSKGRKIALGVFGFALLCGVAGYIAYNQSHPQIQATVVSMSPAPGGQAIAVTFEVDKSASQSVECTLQVEDTQGNVIGSANVAVPSGRAKQDMVYTVNTTGTPNTAVVSSCKATS